MESTGIHSIELILLLLLIFVTALAALAKRIQVPYPIILVVGGLVLSFLPHTPRVALDPDIVFLVILPPLLFSSAYVTSWRDFRYNLVSVTMLAFGLVAFTVLAAAAACRLLLPGFDWPMGLVLGAVVSTTDAIAATSIFQRLGLPKRVTDILEGESLVNDASGLLALSIATTLLVSGHTPTLAEGAGMLLYLVCGGIAVGLVVGKLIHLFELKIDDAPIEITISLMAPYFAYLAAESAHTSGVLATVACGLYLGHNSSLYLSIGARLSGKAVWETLTFVLNGLVFILIGLQLPLILSGIRSLGLNRLLIAGLLFSGILILVRMMWMYPGAWVANVIRRRLLRQEEPMPNPRAIFVVGWTGMRGVVALAAAMALPHSLSDGASFPGRDVMIFVTFCVIFVTLVLQGLTLPALIRFLGLSRTIEKSPEEDNALRAMAGATLAYLERGHQAGQVETMPAGVGTLGGHRASSVDVSVQSPRVVHGSRLTHVSSSTVIEAPVDAVWALLKNFNNVAHWHPDVAESQIEDGGTGRDPGDVRSIRLRDGTPIREKLLAISDEFKVYTYSVIEAPLPIGNHISTVSLSAAPDNRTAITWIAQFMVDDGVDPTAIAAGVKTRVMELGFEGLKAAARKAA
jgi:CPA1 family monovalent cation:H+ antiporter